MLTSDGSHRFGQVHLLEPPSPYCKVLLEIFLWFFYVAFRIQPPLLQSFVGDFLCSLISSNYVMNHPLVLRSFAGETFAIFYVVSWNQPPLAKFCCWIVCNSEKLIQPGCTYALAKVFCGSFYTVCFSKVGSAFFPPVGKPSNGSKLCCCWRNKEMFSSKNAECCNFASIISSCQKSLAPESLFGSCETTNQSKQYLSAPQLVVHIFSISICVFVLLYHS